MSKPSYQVCRKISKHSPLNTDLSLISHPPPQFRSFTMRIYLPSVRTFSNPKSVPRISQISSTPPAQPETPKHVLSYKVSYLSLPPRVIITVLILLVQCHVCPFSTGHVTSLDYLCRRVVEVVSFFFGSFLLEDSGEMHIYHEQLKSFTWENCVGIFWPPQKANMTKSTKFR